MPLVCAYCPVRKPARLGEQSGVVANAFVNRAPSRASRSMFGVSMNGWPATRISSQRMSSTSTMTMFGRRGWAGGGVLLSVSPGAAHVVVRHAATTTHHGAFKLFLLQSPEAQRPGYVSTVWRLRRKAQRERIAVDGEVA